MTLDVGGRGLAFKELREMNSPWRTVCIWPRAVYFLREREFLWEESCIFWNRARYG